MLADGNGSHTARFLREHLRVGPRIDRENQTPILAGTERMAVLEREKACERQPS
jgi:hypothetical protein